MPKPIVQQIAHTLAQHEEIQLAFVFGSAANGTLRPDSDVDVAVLAGGQLSTESRLALMAELSLALMREVDLVDLHNAWGLILRQVLTTGTLTLKRSGTAHAALLKRMLLDQADMEPRAKESLKKIWNGGFDGYRCHQGKACFAATLHTAHPLVDIAPIRRNTHAERWQNG